MSLKDALVEKVQAVTFTDTYQNVASYTAGPPYQIVETVEQETAVHFRGPSGHSLTTVAIESYASTPVSADGYADLISSTFDAVGQSIGTGIDTVQVTSFQTGRTDVLYAPQDASRGFTYGVRQTFDVWHPN